MSIKIVKPNSDGWNNWKEGKFHEGEVAVMESGSYIYHNNEFIRFPIFCATCMHCDIEKCICMKLFDSWGANLKVDPTAFYCANHSTLVDKFE